jgi:DNA invertase Pin-like site-specific DNA recombinase
MTRAALYCRISVDALGLAMGVQRQKHEGHAIAQRLGWTITGEFIDNNVSAARGSKKVRSDYQELLHSIERGDYDAVIVVFEDRLHRQVIELAEFIKVCEAAGVTKFASAGGQFNLSDADQRTMLYIKAAMAEAEVERMRARQLRKQQEFAEQGQPRSGGYRSFGEVGIGKHTTER